VGGGRGESGGEDEGGVGVGGEGVLKDESCVSQLYQPSTVEFLLHLHISVHLWVQHQQQLHELYAFNRRWENDVTMRKEELEQGGGRKERKRKRGLD